MSRAGAKITPNLADKIPLKPEAVVAYEAMMKERKLWMLSTLQREMAARQPKIMVPR